MALASDHWIDAGSPDCGSDRGRKHERQSYDEDTCVRLCVSRDNPKEHGRDDAARLLALTLFLGWEGSGRRSQD
jgi:hypothetical protein